MKRRKSIVHRLMTRTVGIELKQQEFLSNIDDDRHVGKACINVPLPAQWKPNERKSLFDTRGKDRVGLFLLED
jgi:hypothetical protein